MKNKKTIWMILLVFVLLLGGSYLLYNKLGQKVSPNQLAVQESSSDNSGKANTETESEKVLAPDFTVYDLEGNEAHLSDYVGKPIVLNFWASWCGPCQMEMPDFHEKYLKLKDEVYFLMVNMTDGSRETVDTASSFVEEQGYSFPVFYDKDSDAAATYGVHSLPTTYFIDAEGYAVAQVAGAIDAEVLQKGIDMALESE